MNECFYKAFVTVYKYTLTSHEGELCLLTFQFKLFYYIYIFVNTIIV